MLDLKKITKQGKNLRLLQEVVDLLCHGKSLPEKNSDHALAGNWKRYRECHINPDWLLIVSVHGSCFLDVFLTKKYAVIPAKAGIYSSI